jgi:hypothetical protein
MSEHVFVDCPTCYIHYAIPAAMNEGRIEEDDDGWSD